MRTAFSVLITALVLAIPCDAASQSRDTENAGNPVEKKKETHCEEQREVLKRAKLLPAPKLWRRAGAILQIGRCVEKDHAAAVIFYTRAVDAGDLKSALHLGRLYALGLGVAKDEAEARHQFRTWTLGNLLASAKELADSARRALEPFEIPELLKQELAWITALKTAPAERKYRVALKLLIGDGLPLDRAAAFDLLNSASLDGHTAARFELGRGFLERKFPLLVRTREATVSNGLSGLWEAAYRGYRPAQIYLARYCLDHFDHRRSRIGALVLLLRAARNGDTALDPEIQEAERGLSEKDLDYARRQVDDTYLIHCWLDK